MLNKDILQSAGAWTAKADFRSKLAACFTARLSDTSLQHTLIVLSLIVLPHDVQLTVAHVLCTAILCSCGAQAVCAPAAIVYAIDTYSLV
jgi:hypothetical protein